MSKTEWMAGPGVPSRTIPGSKEVLRKILEKLSTLPEETEISTEL